MAKKIEKKQPANAPDAEYIATKVKLEPAVSQKAFQKLMLEKDARPYIEQRLELLRSFRDVKLKEIDVQIEIATDAANTELVAKLRASRQKWRDVTNYYKGLLGSNAELKFSVGDPYLDFHFDISIIANAI